MLVSRLVPRFVERVVAFGWVQADDRLPASVCWARERATCGKVQKHDIINALPVLGEDYLPKACAQEGWVGTAEEETE